jgi:hypothetical protein
MAEHISSVAQSKLLQVTKDELYAQIRPGDLFFCSGRANISYAIEDATKSPFSHVLKAWVPGSWAKQWLTLEATIDRGVHVGVLADYVDNYDGDLVLARRTLSEAEILAEVNAGLALLDDKYDWAQEVSIVGHKLIHKLPVVHPKAQLYCSGLQYVMSLASSEPLQRPAENYPTPEDNWTDPSVTPVCALVRS